MRLYMEGWTVDMGQSLRRQVRLADLVVRYAPNSDQILRGSEMTLSAISVRELERIEVVGAETTYSLARQP